MRNPEKLDNFYAKLCELHKKYVPDWRFAQLMTNFVNALGRDIYYDNEDNTLELLEAWLKHLTEEGENEDGTEEFTPNHFYR